MKKRILVTRQQNLKHFLRDRGFEFAQVLDLDKDSFDDIVGADVYSEDLPIVYASVANSYRHIVLDVPFKKRKKHLSLEEIEQYCTAIQAYKVERL